MRLKDRVALITGAAIGIGRTEACLFAAEGARIMAADINDAGGQETIAAIQSSSGEAIYIHTDVTRASEVQRLIETTIQKFGKIDILVNNAGIPQKPTPIEDIDEALKLKVFNEDVLRQMQHIFMLGAEKASKEAKAYLVLGEFDDGTPYLELADFGQHNMVGGKLLDAEV